MTKEERAEMYRRHLAEEGFFPKIDGDGDVVFKYEGLLFFIAVDDEDEDFFRIVFPNFWSIDSEEERARVERAALEATAKTKVAKVFPVRDDTWATIEIFCTPPESFRHVFRRSLSALRAGIKNFQEAMNE